MKNEDINEKLRKLLMSSEDAIPIQEAIEESKRKFPQSKQT